MPPKPEKPAKEAPPKEVPPAITVFAEQMKLQKGGKKTIKSLPPPDPEVVVWRTLNVLMQELFSTSATILAREYAMKEQTLKN